MPDERLTLDSYYTDATIIYRWRCAICGKEATMESSAPRGGYPLPPYRFPDGDWMLLPGFGDDFSIACPNHSITIVVDEQKAYVKEGIQWKEIPIASIPRR